MRALRVMGLADGERDGATKNLVCEDPSTGEQFSLACDDRLRAGARGDLSRFGQLEIELESQLRPREIQARIRAGATLEQVAAMAGTSSARVERFAYPVLLERASVVQRAMKARPAIDGITAGASVAETVAATLSARGHDADMSWDAFKDDEGWVLTLSWSAGRSENRAHWLFHPGPDGGTLSARDEAAAEIVDPALRVLRPLRPVRHTTPSPVQSGMAAAPSAGEVPTVPSQRPGTSTRPTDHGSKTTHPAGSKLPSMARATGANRGSAASSAGAPAAAQIAVETVVIEAAITERILVETVESVGTGETGDGARLVTTPVVAQAEATRTGTDSATGKLPSVQNSTAAAQVEIASLPLLPAPANAAVSSAAAPGRSTAAVHGGKSARRGQRPVMPSWEDVLLGTRSAGH